MSRTIDYFIDSERDLASFEFFLKEHLNIQSVTLKSIMLFNSWWTSNILPPGVSPFLLSANMLTQIKRLPLDENHWCVNTFNRFPESVPESYKSVDEFCSEPFF